MSGLSDTGTTGTLPFLDQLNLMNEMTFIVHDMTGTYKGALWIWWAVVLDVSDT